MDLALNGGYVVEFEMFKWNVRAVCSAISYHQYIFIQCAHHKFKVIIMIISLSGIKIITRKCILMPMMLLLPKRINIK